MTDVASFLSIPRRTFNCQVGPPHGMSSDLSSYGRFVTFFVTFSIKSSFSLSTIIVTEHRKLAVVESLPSVVPIAVQQILALQMATLPCKPNQTQ